jgi:hypothetical protein
MEFQSMSNIRNIHYAVPGYEKHETTTTVVMKIATKITAIGHEYVHDRQ